MKWESRAHRLILSLSKGEEHHSNSRACVEDEAAALGGLENNEWPIG